MNTCISLGTCLLLWSGTTIIRVFSILLGCCADVVEGDGHACGDMCRFLIVDKGYKQGWELVVHMDCFLWLPTYGLHHNSSVCVVYAFEYNVHSRP